jgi:NitT/TauT family transport system permease protein
MNYVREKISDINKKLLGIYGFAALFIIWQLAPAFKLIDTQFISTPSIIIEAALKIPGDLLVHISTSVQRVLLGYFAAILTAVPLGFLLGGWFPRMNSFLILCFSFWARLMHFRFFRCLYFFSEPKSYPSSL